MHSGKHLQKLESTDVLEDAASQCNRKINAAPRLAALQTLINSVLGSIAPNIFYFPKLCLFSSILQLSYENISK